MLLKKYWWETRTLFFIGVVFIAALCLFFVLAQPWILHRWRMDELADPKIYNPPWLLIARDNYAYFIWHFLYNYLLQFTWAIFTIMLALGGMNGEQEKGTVLYTLALPVARRKLFMNRIVVGFLEACVLAVLPALLIPLASRLIGLHYDWGMAVQHALLFIIGGTVYYMLGVFINTVVKGETIPFFVTIGLVVVFYFLFQPYSEGIEKPFYVKLINLPGFMAGSVDGQSVNGSLFVPLISCLCLSCFLIAVSYRITLKKDF